MEFSETGSRLIETFHAVLTEGPRVTGAGREPQRLFEGTLRLALFFRHRLADIGIEVHGGNGKGWEVLSIQDSQLDLGTSVPGAERGCLIYGELSSNPDAVRSRITLSSG